MVPVELGNWQPACLLGPTLLHVDEAIVPSSAPSTWSCWLSPGTPTPLAAGSPIPKRWSYASWLSAPELTGVGPTRGKGIYIWVLDGGAKGFRFVHVGVAASGAGTIATRTKHHLVRQRNYSDQIRRWRQLPGISFGTLGDDLRPLLQTASGQEFVRNALREFLSQLRLLVLLPACPKSSEPLYIKQTEGIIARTAAYLLDFQTRTEGRNWETTNTLSATARYGSGPECAGRVADSLNSVLSQLLGRSVEMLPRESRRIHHGSHPDASGLDAG